MKKLIFNPVEPLKSNRWIIKLNGMDIPPYLFRKYKIYNEGDEIIFKTEFFETIEWSYNIKDIFNIDEVTIEYLSPVGDVINGVKFKTKGINFERKHSYSDDDLMITKLRLIIDVKSLELLYTHISGKPQLSDEDYIKQQKASMNI
jgi:hypothetical protein